MDTNRRIIAAMELLLISPAALPMTAVVTRHLQSLQYEPAHTAQQIVMWYSARLWTLWVLLIGLPFDAMLTGCATLLQNWNRSPDPQLAARRPSAVTRTDLSTRIIGVATLAAGAILVIVALHMLAN